VHRKGQITHADVGELLHLDRWQTDKLLKDRQAFRPRETEEFLSGLDQLRKEMSAESPSSLADC